MFKLYDFQVEAINFLTKNFKEKRSKCMKVLISSPTSTGKTFIGLKALNDIWSIDKKNIIPIFLTYSRVATEQTKQKLNYLFKNNLIHHDFYKAISSNIMTIHSFCNTNEKANYVIVVDEAHHLTKKSVFNEQLSNMNKVIYLIGLTGTARTTLWEDGFDEAFMINRIDTGIRFPEINLIKIEVSIPELQKFKFKKINHAPNPINILCTNLESENQKKYIELLVNKIYYHSNQFKKAIIFHPFDNGESSDDLLRALRRKFDDCNIVLPLYSEGCKQNSKFIDTIEAFKRNPKVKFLLGDKMLDEALDISSIDALILTKPTSSDIKYSQMIGRGLRVEEGKDETKLYDFRDNYLNHHGKVSQKDYLFKGSKVNNEDYSPSFNPKIKNYIPIVDHAEIRSILLDQLDYFGILTPKLQPSGVYLTPSQVMQFLELFCFKIDQRKYGEYFNRFNIKIDEATTILSPVSNKPLEVPLIKHLIKPLLQKSYGPEIKIEREFPVTGGRIDLLWASAQTIIFEFGIEEVGEKYDQILNYKIKFEAEFKRKVSKCILVGSSFQGSTHNRIIDNINNVEFINWSDFFLSYCEISIHLEGHETLTKAS